MPEKNNNILELLLQNQDKNFVQRIFDTNKYPQRQNADGSSSSHLMAHETIEGGRSIAFPILVQGKYAPNLFMPKNPIEYALENNEYIEFNSLEEAGDFSMDGYKEFFDYDKDLEPKQEDDSLIYLLLNLMGR